MKLINCRVSKSNEDVPIKVLYIVDDKLTANNNELLYNKLYKHYGIRKVEILEQFSIENKDDLHDLHFKYSGYIDLRVFIS